MSACEFPDFVRALPCRKPLAIVQVLSHLLAWYCVGESLKVDDKSEGTIRLHPRVSINAVAHVTSVQKCKSLCGEDGDHQGTIFPNASVPSMSLGAMVKLEGTVLVGTLLGNCFCYGYSMGTISLVC